MKENAFWDGISNINPDIVECFITMDRELQENLYRKKVRILFSAIAACLVLIIGVIHIVPGLVIVDSQAVLEYTVYEVGINDSLDFGTHENEYALWSSEKLGLHQDETVPLEMTVEFNGKTYVGEYSWSYIKMPNVYISDRYKSGKVFFEVNADTGALTYVMFARNPSWSATLTEDDCQKITDGIADDYIDLSAYQTKTSVTPIENTNNYYYSCQYYREIDGYQTNDLLNIVVDGEGNVVIFEAEMLHSFDGVTTVGLAADQSRAAVDAKLETIYQKNTDERTHTVKDVRLIRLEDGSFAHYYTVNNSFIRMDGETQHSYGSLVNVLVTAKPKDK